MGTFPSDPLKLSQNVMTGEFELIKKLSRILPPVSKRIETGIGDDTAVLKPVLGRILFTVDTLVEGIHFDFSFCTPKEVGEKALAVNVSDIVAMGGTPRAAVVALGISGQTTEEQCKEIYRGLTEAAKKYQVDVVGGNISQSPERFFISISLLGESEGAVLGRHGAKPGDLVFVTGFVGEASAGLALLKKEGRKVISEFPGLTERYLKPDVHCELGRELAQSKGVTSLIDISDGLSSELCHLSEASRVSIAVREEALISSSELERASQMTEKPLLEYQLAGGDDYELLGTCSPEGFEKLKKLAGRLHVPISEIGKVEEGEGAFFLPKTGPKRGIQPLGWNHFRS